MNDDLVQRLLRQHAVMLDERRPWENHWGQIARRVLPRGDNFNGMPSPGGRRTQDVFDSTATIALEKFAAGIEGLVAPRAQRWHGLASPNRTLNDKPEIRRYFGQVNDLLFESRYAASSGFATQLHEVMINLGAFGTGPMWIEDDPGRSIIYTACDLSEIAIDVDRHGRVDTIGREFEWTVRQAAQKWGMDNLPASVRAAHNQPDRKFKFTHMIAPRQDFDALRADAKGMRWGSWYMLAQDQALVSEGGYHSMPLPCCRYTTAPREKYGRSVAMMALPDIKMANEIAKGIVRSVHKALDPALLLPDDGVLTRMNTRPGALNVGGVNSRGEALVRPLQTGGDINVGMELLGDTRQNIKDAFLVSLFETLANTSDRMTATEVLERLRERGVLLAPASGRIETELLGPLIEREIDIHTRAGRMPAMPAELEDAGGEYKIVYDNPMSRAAKAEQATGFFRTIEALGPIAQIEPTVYDTFDFAEAARGVAEIGGVPPAWMRSPDQIAALKDERTQASEVQGLVEAAPQIAGAALDAAKAEQLGGGFEVAA
ncbi:MAG: portal protein [Polymorphobacter sp.]